MVLFISKSPTSDIFQYMEALRLGPVRLGPVLTIDLIYIYIFYIYMYALTFELQKWF